MSSEDYLIRQFRQLGAFFAALMGYFENEDHNRILQEIDQALDTWFDIGTQKWAELSESDVQNHLFSKTINWEEERSLAELLFYRLKSMVAIGQYEEAGNLALRLYERFKIIDRQSGEYSTDIQERIAETTMIARQVQSGRIS